MGPGQLGLGAQFSGAQLFALKKWQIGPRTVRPWGLGAKLSALKRWQIGANWANWGPICLEPTHLHLYPHFWLDLCFQKVNNIQSQSHPSVHFSTMVLHPSINGLLLYIIICISYLSRITFWCFSLFLQALLCSYPLFPNLLEINLGSPSVSSHTWDQKKPLNQQQPTA